MKHLLTQFQEFKHLLISSDVLTFISIPRLMLAFLSGYMKSIVDLWIYLSGYFISFIFPLLIFPIFILPCRRYQKKIYDEAKRLFTKPTKFQAKICLISYKESIMKLDGLKYFC